jgi:hypothetical protein
VSDAINFYDPSSFLVFSIVNRLVRLNIQWRCTNIISHHSELDFPCCFNILYLTIKGKRERDIERKVFFSIQQRRRATLNLAHTIAVSVLWATYRVLCRPCISCIATLYLSPHVVNRCAIEFRISVVHFVGRRERKRLSPRPCRVCLLMIGFRLQFDT